MLATLGGTLALAVGVAVLLLPVLVSELSRPRDAAWGAVVLLLGLVLVTSAERLTGSPMLAVLCGGLLIGRLGTEVGLARWRQLTQEERQRLGSTERWRSSLEQLAASLAGLAERAGGVLSSLGGTLGGLGGAVTAGRKPKAGGKRWVRPENPAAAVEAIPEGAGEAAGEAAVEAAGETCEEATVAVVRDFAEIDERLQAAGEPEVATRAQEPQAPVDPPLPELPPAEAG